MNWSRYSNPYSPSRRRGRAPAKSQLIRILDIGVIGPLMVWGGTRAGGIGGAALALFGVSTIGYNAVNYARVEQGEAC